MTPIHPWNSKGLLDPISAPLARKRAPYLMTPLELVDRFGHTFERRQILAGYFRYRAGLRDLKITTGFQWIDGSFVEEIEVLEHRPPGDIDIVTFYELPPGESQKSILAKAPEYFPSDEEEKKTLKALFCVDGTMSCLDVEWARLIKQAIYFYSVWSHRRDHTWKGFIQVDLNADGDEAAITRIAERDVKEGIVAMLEHKDEI